MAEKIDVKALCEFVLLYERIYMATQTHPSIVEEAECIGKARAILTARAEIEATVFNEWRSMDSAPDDRPIEVQASPHSGDDMTVRMSGGRWEWATRRGGLLAPIHPTAWREVETIDG